MPDGVYQIKLVASDRPNNPLNEAKSDEKTSEWFIVDHTPPIVKNLVLHKSEREGYVLEFQATDNLSALRSAYFSFNAKDWQWINPVDGICDSKKERFRIHLQNGTESVHTIVVKVIDERENTGYGRLFLGE